MPSIGITFDHSNGVYNSGETLNGSVELRTNTSETIRGISLKINGYVQVKWTEDRGSKNGVKQIEEFSSYHQYLNFIKYLIGSDTGQPFELQPGTYNHSFTCLLPSTLPTSCQEEYGEIKYEIIVTTDLPYMFDNVFKHGFTVIQQLNLNSDPTLQVPKVVEDFELPCCCCCCCGCGKVTAELTIPFSGYVPGQKINYQMFVFNNTDKDLEKAKIKLQKCITFESRTPHRKERHTKSDIYVKNYTPILRLTRKEFTDSIQLPAIPPSSINPEEYIKIDYLLTGKVMIGCCANNIVLVIPIKIGTIPIMENDINLDNVISMQPTVPTAPIIDQNNEIAICSGGGSDSPPPYMSEAPPSYEMPFIPKYPVYHNISKQQQPSLDSEKPSTSSVPDYGWSLQQ